MQNNFPKIPLLLSILFFVFSCSAFMFFYRFINRSNNEGDTAVLEWKKEARRREDIKKLDDSIKIIEAERAELQNHFATSSDIVPFLDTIEKLALNMQVIADVSSVAILENNAGLLVGINTSGNFENLYRFIILLENSPYELEFISMDMHKMGGDISGGNVRTPWEATFQIRLISFTK